MAAQTRRQNDGKGHPDPTDIVHTGGLDGMSDYTVFRLRYAKKKNLPVRLLNGWHIQEALPAGKGKICLVGNYRENIIRTSAVVGIQSSRRIVTTNGVYILGEDSKVLANGLRGGLHKLFADGFPENWKAAAHEALVGGGPAGHSVLHESHCGVPEPAAEAAASPILGLDACEAKHSPGIFDFACAEEPAAEELPAISYDAAEEPSAIGCGGAGEMQDSAGKPCTVGVLESMERSESDNVPLIGLSFTADDESEKFDDTPNYSYTEGSIMLDPVRDMAGGSLARVPAKEGSLCLETNENIGNFRGSFSMASSPGDDIAKSTLGEAAFPPKSWAEANVPGQAIFQEASCIRNTDAALLGYCGLAFNGSAIDDSSSGFVHIPAKADMDDEAVRGNNIYATVEEALRSMPFYKNGYGERASASMCELPGVGSATSQSLRGSAPSCDSRRSSYPGLAIDVPAISAEAFLSEMNGIVYEAENESENDGCSAGGPMARESPENEPNVLDIAVVNNSIVIKKKAMSIGDPSAAQEPSHDFPAQKALEEVISSPEDPIRPDLCLLNNHMNSLRAMTKAPLAFNQHEYEKFSRISESGAFSEGPVSTAARTEAESDSLPRDMMLHSCRNSSVENSHVAETPRKRRHRITMAKSLGAIPAKMGPASPAKRRWSDVAAEADAFGGFAMSDLGCNAIAPANVEMPPVVRESVHQAAEPAELLANVAIPAKKKLSIDIPVTSRIRSSLQPLGSNSESMAPEDGPAAADGPPDGAGPAEGHGAGGGQESASSLLPKPAAKIARSTNEASSSAQKKRRRTICRFKRK